MLVTGGTGSWGQELTQKLLKFKPKEIRIYSRGEAAQVNMQRKFSPDDPIHFIIGDVRDEEAMEEACKNVDYVFHLAALKHVPICEIQPDEAIKTNVKGTENVIRASIANGVKKVIDVSTDKAVDPVNFYGLTKAIGEKLMIQANDRNTDTRFVCIRGGNVLGTNGSVVPYFTRQIIEKGEVTLTSYNMTRFFLTISEAIDLLLRAAIDAIGGETFVMKMKACRIVELAEVLSKQLSSKPVQMKEIGIRPGEKLHEVLVSSYESPYTYQYNHHYYIIIPAHATPELHRHYDQLQKATFKSYASNSELMSQKEIEEMLRQGGFI